MGAAGAAAAIASRHHREDPEWTDPVIPKCKVCKHDFFKHTGLKCKHRGLIHKCDCTGFFFDSELFEKSIKYEMLDEEGWFDKSDPNDVKQLNYMKPLVEKHMRQYQIKAEELSKQNTDATSKVQRQSGDKVNET